jgi:hypothetical protein
MNVLLALAINLLGITNPFNGIGKSNSLKGYEEGQLVLKSAGYQDYIRKGKVLANAVFLKGHRKVRLLAIAFPTEKILQDTFRVPERRNAAVIGLPMEGLGEKISMVGDPFYLESDIFEGKIWVRTMISRPRTPFHPKTPTSWHVEAAKLLEKDTDTLQLVKGLLPELRK